jgi:nitroimidazol reductase NimA-like FMN-containing flavoprotein (pyridoxamine 5'-phosphate oxidase superfamily)
MHMSDYHNKRALEILNEILYITIASVSSEGKPWNTPVYSAFDDDLNFYWFSDKNAQHSKNVQANPEVCLAIYDSTVPQGTGEGVYIEAVVEELQNESEVMAARKRMDERVGRTKERKFATYSGDAVLRGYKAIPRKAWMNEVEQDKKGRFVRDIRVEVPLQILSQTI